MLIGQLVFCFTATSIITQWTILKDETDGVFFCRQVAQSELDLDLVKTILGEYKIHNADVTLREDVTAEDLIDVVEGNRVYIPCLYLLNKIDQISIEVQKKSRIGKKSKIGKSYNFSTYTKTKSRYL